MICCSSGATEQCNRCHFVPRCSGYGDDETSVQIELTYNWDPPAEPYTKGDAYAQIAVSTTVRRHLPCLHLQDAANDYLANLNTMP